MPEPIQQIEITIPVGSTKSTCKFCQNPAWYHADVAFVGHEAPTCEKFALIARNCRSYEEAFEKLFEVVLS